ncbi:ArdC-like ssDNA-binding domain-containing protein [Pseudarthrobacter sp. H3Y2-7]|uniref:ArdC-like ssDNA-binding domain-containing protein n=1 Tax=Pseudarthrobacter naphthalenicus TaxID=3031328 RepID=UPI0023B03373|nr:ArdC-like ssDNA-binding domain-containing protein [Pseudarthrobacter sp. H3Y2-7]MDE8670840.1 ArdC-like ssDNA-binding domain-containing protein [Pseudarthrobacter sp. H3Y2-7]
MATATKTRKTAEERKAQAEALHAQLTAQIETFTSSAEWMKFLAFAQAFHAYSLNNVILILSQCNIASRVAGFRRWQDLGRQVRKGEKAIRIFGYSTKKVTETNEATGEDEEKTVVRFPILSVFDISQTDVIEGAEDYSSPARRLTGSDDLGIVANVTEFLTARGWSVTHEAIPGEVNGYTTTDGTRRVVIDANLSPAQAAKTAIHEAAHVILHAEEDHKEYVAHRGVKETEAESVAYVMAGMLGLDTSAYSVGYVAGWAKADMETIKATAANVLRAVHELAEALDTDDEAA